MQSLTARFVVPLLLLPCAVQAQQATHDATAVAEPAGVTEPSGVAAAPAAAPSPAVVRADARGFALQSADERFELRLRGYAQVVGRFYPADADNLAHDGLFLRRVRPAVQARLWDDFELRMLVDFAGARVELLDATATWRPHALFGVRVGKMKSPVSAERLQSPTATTFLERAYPASVAPNRDMGVVVVGEAWEAALGWELGVFNGVPDGASGETNPNDLFDVAGRVVARPGRAADVAALEELTLSAAATWGPQRGSTDAPELSGYRSPGGRRFVRPAADGSAEGTAVAEGGRLRVAGALSYAIAGFGVAGEYIFADHAVRHAGTQRSLAVSAWAAAIRYVIGADASFEGVDPRAPIGGGGAGAVEIKARAEQLTVDATGSLLTAASTATTLSGGVTWWLNRNVRVLGDVHHTTFAGSETAEPAENVVFTTVQIGF